MSTFVSPRELSGRCFPDIRPHGRGGTGLECMEGWCCVQALLVWGTGGPQAYHRKLAQAALPRAHKMSVPTPHSCSFTVVVKSGGRMLSSCLRMCLNASGVPFTPSHPFNLGTLIPSLWGTGLQERKLGLGNICVEGLKVGL